MHARRVHGTEHPAGAAGLGVDLEAASQSSSGWRRHCVSMCCHWSDQANGLVIPKASLVLLVSLLVAVVVVRGPSHQLAATANDGVALSSSSGPQEEPPSADVQEPIPSINAAKRVPDAQPVRGRRPVAAPHSPAPVATPPLSSELGLFPESRIVDTLQIQQEIVRLLQSSNVGDSKWHQTRWTKCVSYVLSPNKYDDGTTTQEADMARWKSLPMTVDQFLRTCGSAKYLLAIQRQDAEFVHRTFPPDPPRREHISRIVGAFVPFPLERLPSTQKEHRVRDAFTFRSGGYRGCFSVQENKTFALLRGRTAVWFGGMETRHCQKDCHRHEMQPTDHLEVHFRRFCGYVEGTWSSKRDELKYRTPWTIPYSKTGRPTFGLHMESNRIGGKMYLKIPYEEDCPEDEPRMPSHTTWLHGEKCQFSIGPSSSPRPGRTVTTEIFVIKDV